MTDDVAADRARGCLLALAAGDALGRPAENRTPREIAERWGVLRELEPGPGGAPAGTDDTEYSVFVSLLLERHGSAVTTGDFLAAWRSDIVSVTGPLKGAGFSEGGTVQAIRRGLLPPATGSHHHAWSDGLAMRAAPYGVFADGRPALAAALVTADGTVSHSGEGILGGRAVAAGVAVAMTGASPADVASAALSAIPDDSWTARSLRRACAVVDAAARAAAPTASAGHPVPGPAVPPGSVPPGSVPRGPAVPGLLTPAPIGSVLPGSAGFAEFAERLHEAVVVRHYPWTDLAPEAVALAFAAYLVGDGDVESAVVTAANLGRDADTTAAIAGALAGAGRGESEVPRRWATAIGPLRGSCLPSVAGLDVRDVGERVLAAAHREEATGATPHQETSVAAAHQAGAAAHRDGTVGVASGRAMPAVYRDRTLGTVVGGGAAADAGPPEPSARGASPATGGTRRGTVAGTTGRRAEAWRGAVRGAFVGLGIGDAASWPAARHRFGLLAPWTRRVYRELDGFAEEHRLTTLPVPFALNQPVEPLAPGPSDDAEWLAFTASTMDRERAAAYRGLIGRDDIRARVSVRTAVDNLAAGLEPPVTGHDNPHHFDDAAAVRAVAFGAAHPGEPAAAAAGAQADAEVTNAYDGIAAARALAAAVSVAADGIDAMVAAAVHELPDGSAIRHKSETALAVVAGRDAFDAVPDLAEALTDHVYSYGVAASDTVPAALALAAAAGGRLAVAVPAAACLTALADSVPALVGALCGAATGYEALPHGWRETGRRLAGCCLPELAGTDLLDVADRLHDKETRR